MTNNRVTTNAIGEPTGKPTAKVVAGAIGAGVAGAITTLGVYVYETVTAVDLPQPVEGAILTLVAAGVGLAAAYLKRPGATR